MSQPVTFRSRGESYCIVRVPDRRVIDAKGDTYRKPGVRYQFKDHVFTTADPDVVEFLRSHPKYGVQFFEAGKEPGRLLPAEEDVLREITAAAVARDADRLGELLSQEQATHKRDRVIAAARAALEAIAEGEPIVTSGDEVVDPAPEVGDAEMEEPDTPAGED